jgi:Ca2+-binding RTX toxin-like protein
LIVLSGLVAVPATGAIVTCGGLPTTEIGTPGDDLITGTPGIDVIAGLGGNDIIRGFGGDDVLCGNGGHDQIFGGGGHDWISGGTGRDHLLGLRSGDTIYGGPGRDAISGGPGSDDLYGGTHRDVIRGGDRNDRLRGGNGDDTLIGGLGADRAWGNSAVDFCRTEIRSGCESFDPELRLASDGIGSQGFGDLTDAALLEFAALLGDAADEGDPDEDSGWIDSFSIYGTCPNDHVRVVRWGDVEIFNTRVTGFDGEFFTWEVYDPLDDREDKELVTTLGIRWADTGAQLDVAYGNAVTTDYLDIWDLYLFYLDGDPSGLRGSFTGGDHFDTIALLGGGPGCGE